jgi:hypothetical protein
MTVSMNADQVVGSIQLAAGIGAFLGVLILGLLIFWMVRPSRRAKREAPVTEQDALDMEEVLNVLEGMERRLGTLERAMIEQDEAPRIGSRENKPLKNELLQNELLDAGDESPAKRRER